MHECRIAAHAICVRTAMLSLCSVLNFLRSRLTREHNASYFLISWKELPLSECKISYFIDVLHYIERNYNLNPLLFLGSSVDCSNPCRSFSHCFLNHSPIGCLFTVSTNLLSSTKLFSTLKMSFLISNLRLCSSE